MVVFPNCKINLGLNILRKRDDGFHDLETVFYPIPLKDSLEIITYPQQHTTKEAIQFSSSGLSIDGELSNNLCIKAWNLLKNDLDLPPIKMHLHKVIPMGAGLGGGSADGAFALKLLNEKFNLGLSVSQLSNYALQLGSDGPFFILNKPCLATGRGEVLESINLTLKGYVLVLINPGIHINTGWGFSQLIPSIPENSIKEIIQQPISTWKDHLKNDFEKPVFEKHPEIKKAKEELYNAGAIYAAMTGTGSTVFGIFAPDHTPHIPQKTNYFHFETIINT